MFYAFKLLPLLNAVVTDDTVEFQQFLGRFHVNFHAAQRINDLYQLLKVDRNIFRNICAEIFVDRADGKARAAKEVGGVELVLAVAVDIDERVAHQAGHLDLAAGVVHGHNHHAVRVALGVAFAGIQTKQCDVCDVLIRLDTGRQILAKQRSIVGVAEERTVDIQPQAKQDAEQDQNGQYADEFALEAF